MKWSPEECAFGDMVRVKIGTVYHYGIYVSEEEIIQFGYAPTYYTGEHKNEPILVCKTDVFSFLHGGIIEIGTPTKKERKQMFTPSVIVLNARRRLGQGGYDIIHNNCEHFVYECAFGRKYSEQEEQIREKWNKRPRAYVYVSFEDRIDGIDYMPKLRKQEIAETSNDILKEEKIKTWTLLNFALKDCFNVDPQNVKFSKNKNGKWIAKGYWFSLSHTQGAVAVVVSNEPCGIDIENIMLFKKKVENPNFSNAFSKKIGKNSCDYLELLQEWTGKESLYKVNGEGVFSPTEIHFDNREVKHVLVGDYVCAVAGTYSSLAMFYKVENGKSMLLSKEECKCL